MSNEKENMDSEQVVTAALQFIPFENLIGGPLAACVKAQEIAAGATWRYIQDVGFSTSPDDENKQEAIIISFLFQQDNVVRKLSMPLLTLVPVPYISIDTIDLTFQADMSATSEGELMAKFSNSKDSVSVQQSKYNIQNIVDINIRATSGSMPAGIAKMLDLFSNNCIRVRKYEEEAKVEEPEEVEEPDETENTDGKQPFLIKQKNIAFAEQGEPIAINTPTYSVALIKKLTDKNKAGVVGAILDVLKDSDLTQDDILSCSGSVNKTIVANLSYEESLNLVNAIIAAGGYAEAHETIN